MLFKICNKKLVCTIFTILSKTIEKIIMYYDYLKLNFVNFTEKLERNVSCRPESVKLYGISQ